MYMHAYIHAEKNKAYKIKTNKYFYKKRKLCSMKAFTNSLKLIEHIPGILGIKSAVHVRGLSQTRQPDISAFEDLLVQQRTSDNKNK